MAESDRLGAVKTSPKLNRLVRLGQGIALLGVVYFTVNFMAHCLTEARYAQWLFRVWAGQPMTINGQSWLAGTAVLFGFNLINVAPLFVVMRLLESFRSGDLFGVTMERGLRHMSYWYVAIIGEKIFADPLLFYTATYFNPAGPVSMMPRFSFVAILPDMIITISLLLLSEIIKEARRAKEENEGFI